MKWTENENERRPLELRLYHGGEGNTPCLTFEPWNTVSEEQSCSEPLVVYFEDYRRLLKSYFALMFPTKDALDGTPEPIFDELYRNWLSADDWNKALSAIRRDLPTFSDEERGFYEAFLKWFDEALALSNIIICYSNL